MTIASCHGDGAPRESALRGATAEAGPHPSAAGVVNEPSPFATMSLAPAEDCTQPAAAPACESGYCRIERGCFVMGAPRGEPGAGRLSNVQVQVTLNHSFTMGQTEVTNEAWSQTGWGRPERDIAVGTGTCLEPPSVRSVT